MLLLFVYMITNFVANVMELWVWCSQLKLGATAFIEPVHRNRLNISYCFEFDDCLQFPKQFEKFECHTVFAELRFYEIFRSHFWWDIITLPAVLSKYMWNWSSTRCDWLRGVYHHLRTVAVDYGIGNISPSWMDYIRWDKSDICKKSVILTRKEWYLQGKYIWIPWYDRTRMAILMCYFLMLLMCLTKNVKNVILKKNICYWIAYILYDPVGRNLTICNKNGNDIKNNAWVTVSNDFLVTSQVICQWFSRVMKSPVKIIGKSPHDWQKNHYSW